MATRTPEIVIDDNPELNKMVSRALAILAIGKQLDAEFKQIKAAIEQMVPADRVSQSIVTPAGIVKRTVKNEILWKNVDRTQLLEFFKEDYGDYVGEKVELKVAAKARSSLVPEPATDLQRFLNDHIKIDSTVSVAFLPITERNAD